MAVIDGEWLSKEGLTYFWSKIKAIFTKQTETNVIANLGAKNLLKVASTTQTVNGVTFTVNDDQTITVNGTASATITYVIAPNAQAILIPDGTYVLSGCPSGGGATTFDLRWYLYSSGKSAYDQGSGASVAKDGNTTSSNVAIVIKSGVTANNLVFKPMVRPAEITDSSFKPYAPTNRELYETRFASKTILPNNVDLNDIKAGGIYNGVNSTGNSAVHMPVATGSFNFVLTVIEANEFIIQIFKQLNSAGDPNLYIRRFYIYNSDWDSWYQFTGTQV